MSYHEIFIVLILSLWLMASVIYALFNKKIARISHRADMFRLLSSFQLFSGKAELFHLSYRDLQANDKVTAWQEVSLNHRWKLYHAIWYPQNTIPECIKSIMDDLIRIVRNVRVVNGSRAVNDRFIYHALFQFLKRYPQDKASLGRQLRIQDCDNNVLFISDFYKG